MVNYLIGGKIRRGKVTKFWPGDENFPRRIIFPDEYREKWRNFTNETFSPTKKVIKELLKDIEVVVIDDELPNYQ